MMPLCASFPDREARMIASKSMQALYALSKKELTFLAESPAAPGAVLFMILGCGIPFLFPSHTVMVPDFTLQEYVSRIPLLSVLFFPALAAGCWESERKNGSMNILLSFPVPNLVLVAGKIVPQFFIYAITLMLALPLVLSLPALTESSMAIAGSGVVLSTYVMYLIFGFTLASLTTYLSIRFEGNVVPFLLSSSCIFIFDTIHLVPSLAFLPARLAQVCAWLSAAWHLESASRGILDSRDILFFILPSIALLFASTLRLDHIRRNP